MATEKITLKVVIVIDHDQVELDSKWFVNKLTNHLFQECDNAEVELHIIPENKE